MSDELKPCPFCGNDGWHEFHLVAQSGGVRCFNSTCPIYDIRIPLEAWNRRAAPQEPTAPTCEWIDNEEDGYSTSCGHRWTFIADGPKENGVKFCPYCGKPLVDSAAH